MFGHVAQLHSRQAARLKAFNPLLLPAGHDLDSLMDAAQGGP